jgi:alpha-beta hydrolase superfamily lysophospholipase
MPLLSLLATALLSIFCAPAFASLEPEFDLAGEAALTCSQTRPLEECYAPAAAAVRAYLASRPDRHKDFGSSHRLFAGPRANLTGAPTERVYVLIHGYTMAPDEEDQLLEEVARRGANAIVVDLEAHGSRGTLGGGPVAMHEATAEDWKRDAHFAVMLAHGLGRKVFVVGYSLGGLLGILEGSAPHPLIDGFFAVAPPVALDDKLWGGPGACAAKPLLWRGLDKRIGNWEGGSEWNKAYNANYLDGVCELLKLVTEFNHAGKAAGLINSAFKYQHRFLGEKMYADLQRKDFARLKVPYVLLMSPTDNVVDYETLLRLPTLSTGKGLFIQSACPYHTEYGLMHPGTPERELYLQALDSLELLTK